MAHSYFSIINHTAFMLHHAVIFWGEEFSKFERNTIQSADAENALSGNGKVYATVANMLFLCGFHCLIIFCKECRFSQNFSDFFLTSIMIWVCTDCTMSLKESLESMWTKVIENSKKKCRIVFPAVHLATTYFWGLDMQQNNIMANSKSNNKN